MFLSWHEIEPELINIEITVAIDIFGTIEIAIALLVYQLLLLIKIPIFFLVWNIVTLSVFTAPKRCEIKISVLSLNNAIGVTADGHWSLVTSSLVTSDHQQCPTIALNSDKASINGVTARGIYFTPFRRSEHRQSNIMKPFVQSSQKYLCQNLLSIVCFLCIIVPSRV